MLWLTCANKTALTARAALPTGKADYAAWGDAKQR